MRRRLIGTLGAVLLLNGTAQAQTQEWVQTSDNLGAGISISVPHAQVVGSDPSTVYVTGLIETPDLGCFNTACQWATLAYDSTCL